MGIGWRDVGQWWIRGPECILILWCRPPYCNRGNYQVYLEAWGELGRDIDHADMWPRLYFDFDVAKSEGIAWLRTRKQFKIGLSAWIQGELTLQQIAACKVETISGV